MDRLTTEERSAVMSRVRSKNTRPELVVRRLLHNAGARFRLHQADLPGCPDIVLSRHRLAVFVHGCFWHSHKCPRGRRPKQNSRFWKVKLDKNRRRDASSRAKLSRLGWRAITIWECQLKDLDAVQSRLIKEIADQ